MSDTLQEAEEQFERCLTEHNKRLKEDPEYRKRWDSIPDGNLHRPVLPVGTW